jgi:hypothetical protein
MQAEARPFKLKTFGSAYTYFVAVYLFGGDFDISVEVLSKNASGDQE